MVNFKESKLNNGLKIITGENKNSEVITMEFIIRAGSKYEKSGQRGYAHLLEHIISRGGGSNFSSNFDLVVDRSGAKFNAHTDAETIYVSAQVVSGEFKSIGRLVVDALLNPVIDGNILENEKKVVLEELKKIWDKKDAFLWMETSKNVFKNYPLSNYPIGEESDILGADEKSITDYYKNFFVPNNALFICNGSIKHEDVCAFINEEVAIWPIASTNNENSQKELDYENIFLNNNSHNIIHVGGTLDYISLSIPVPDTSIKSVVCLNIIANYLGYRRTSLFYGELRRKLGLIYSISVSNIPFKELSLFYIFTSTAFSEKVLPIIKDKILNLCNYFTEEIFKEYKMQIINIFKMELNDPFRINGFIKNNWVLYEKLITPDDVINAIKETSYDDVIKIINKYFKKEKLFITILEKSK